MSGEGDFRTTRWSVVAAAAEAPAGSRLSGPAREALQSLCESYWEPLYAYARRRGESPEDACDLVQSYFARLIESGDLGAADASRGRFRAFLLASFRHHLSHRNERARAQKRGGGRPVLSLDAREAERRWAAEPIDGETPERCFERRFALAALDRVFERLGAEQARAGRGELFERLRPHLAGEAETTHRAIARELGTSDVAVRVAAHRLRLRFAELLREEVAGTLAGREEVAAELRALLHALA